MPSWPELQLPVGALLSGTKVFAVPFVTPFAGALGTLSNVSWPTANKAIYLPFRWLTEINLTGLSIGIVNGSTSGNIDIGIYSEDGRKLASSGSVAQSGGGQNLTFSSNPALKPGIYYLGVSMDNNVGQLQVAQPGVSQLRMVGVLEQASAFPLPSLATFAQNSVSYFPQLRINIAGNQYLGDALKGPAFPCLPTLHTYSYETVGAQIINHRGLRLDECASAAWPAANSGMIIVAALGRRTRFQRAFAFNGAAVAGNIDIGVYDKDLKLLFSTGSTPQSGTNALQLINVDWTVGPGIFFLALAASSSSATFFRATATDTHGFDAGTVRTAASSFPLPATFVITSQNNYAPLFGLAKGTVI